MPHTQQPTIDSNSILEIIHPTVSIAIAIACVCVWVYTTFVTMTNFNTQVAELNNRTNDKYQQAIEHSDANFSKMTTKIDAVQSTLNEVRESMHDVQHRLYDRQKRD